MSKPFSGGGAIFDLNWLSDGVVGGPPVGCKAQIIVHEFGGSGGSFTIEQLELYLSVLKPNTSSPCDTNVVYLGDDLIRTNTPWSIKSNCPKGLNADGHWETSCVIFKPGGDGKLPLVPQPDDNWACKYAFSFWMQVLSLSHPVPFPGPIGLTTLSPTLCNQSAILRGLYSNGQETSSIYGTQTKLIPWNPPM